MEPKKRGRKPRVNSEGAAELDAFKENLETLQAQKDEAPVVKTEAQTKLSQEEIHKNNKDYLKPVRSISSREKFNEKYRKDYEEKKQYVNFIAENKEIIGEAIEMWTKGFPGCPAEFWRVPVNKPIWAPRYVAEQIKGAQYHVFVMDGVSAVQQAATSQVEEIEYHGSMIVKNKVNRLDAQPVSQNRSVFMGN